MLEGINTALTNAVKKVGHENVGPLFYAGAGAIACRKFLMAGGYKLAGKGAELIGSTLAADKWNKAASETYQLARKDAVRDLTAVAGFIAAVAAIYTVNEIVKAEVEDNKSWGKWASDCIWKTPLKTYMYTVGTVGTLLPVLAIGQRVFCGKMDKNKGGMRASTNRVSVSDSQSIQSSPFRQSVSPLRSSSQGYGSYGSSSNYVYHMG